MSVKREDNEWLLYSESGTGIRSRVYDVVLPADLEEKELLNYLDDIYHEWADENCSSVIRLS